MKEKGDLRILRIFQKLSTFLMIFLKSYFLHMEKLQFWQQISILHATIFFFFKYNIIIWSLFIFFKQYFLYFFIYISYSPHSTIVRFFLSVNPYTNTLLQRLGIHSLVFRANLSFFVSERAKEQFDKEQRSDGATEAIRSCA